MKRLLLILIATLFLVSCEDVIEVALNETTPKLVIDGKLTRSVETNDSNVYVRLTTTAPFFDTVIPEISNAVVRITTLTGSTLLSYTENGIYTADIVIENDTEYVLEVVYKNETFTATEILETVPPLEFVEQREDGGFTNEDIELKAFFTDPASVDNFYFFEGLSSRGNVYDSFFDEFFDGNLIFGFYFIEDIEPEDEILFYLSGVDEEFYNFMFTLLQQSSDQSGGPFETQPATVRGNILNISNPDNFPLGYFRVSEVSSLSYTVQ